MNKLCLSIIFLSLICISPLFAQSVKNPRYIEQNAQYDRGATYDINPQKVDKKRARHHVRYANRFDQEVQEYYDRMEANAKKYKKMEREMKKPQYSDPTYFGHKHPPKKRPPGKKKYCKVCGMYH